MFDVAKLQKIIGMAKRFLEELRIFFNHTYLAPFKSLTGKELGQVSV